MGLSEGLVLLVFFLFLIGCELLCFFEDHILILIGHGLYLGVLC